MQRAQHVTGIVIELQHDFVEVRRCKGAGDAGNRLALAACPIPDLGLRDLVLTQVLFVVGLGWVGTAAKVGSSHIVFWLLGIVLFYLPSAVVVIYLTRLMPLEGGLYQWSKAGFGELVGFLVAWNLWLYVIVNTSELGLQVTTYFSYALGARAAWIAASRPISRRATPRPAQPVSCEAKISAFVVPAAWHSLGVGGAERRCLSREAHCLAPCPISSRHTHPWPG